MWPRDNMHYACPLRLTSSLLRCHVEALRLVNPLIPVFPSLALTPPPRALPVIGNFAHARDHASLPRSRPVHVQPTPEIGPIFLGSGRAGPGLK